MTLGFLGWNIPAVHRSMDWAVRVIGPGHQVVLHDANGLRAMELLHGRRGLVIAAVHVLEDLGIVVPVAEPSPKSDRVSQPRLL